MEGAVSPTPQGLTGVFKDQKGYNSVSLKGLPAQNNMAKAKKKRRRKSERRKMERPVTPKL